MHIHPCAIPAGKFGMCFGNGALILSLFNKFAISGCGDLLHIQKPLITAWLQRSTLAQTSGFEKMVRRDQMAAPGYSFSFKSPDPEMPHSVIFLLRSNFDQKAKVSKLASINCKIITK